MRHKRNKIRSSNSIPIENLDAKEILDDLDIYYTESGKNVSDGWIGVTCPFCDDHSNHLGINIQAKTISCFKCGRTGTIISYLIEVLNSKQKALQIVNKAMPRELRSFKIEGKTHARTVNLPKEATQEPSKYHRAYLRKRRFSPNKLIDRYNLYFCPPYGKWANRIIIPIIRNHRLITFTSVDISDETRMRYRHEKDENSILHIKQYLFGLEWTNGHTIIVTEGLFDMLRIGDGAVCTFGVILTPEQKRILSTYSRVKIVFDGDKDGYRSAENLANDLSPFCDVQVFMLPEGVDPDKLTLKDIRQIRGA